MRKFHFAQPFTVSGSIDKCPAENIKSFDIKKADSFNQHGDFDYNQEPSNTAQDNFAADNGYVSGAIDLDRALTEYYKSLVR